MKTNAEIIYQELIENKLFFEWVKSDNQLHQEYWAQWKKDNPDSGNSLKRAIQTVKLIEFKGGQMNPSMVSLQWDEVKKQIDKKPNHLTIKLIISKLQYAAAVLFLPILLFSTYLIYQNNKLHQENMIIADSQSGIMHTIKASQGSKITVDLPDSSRVLLNSGSSLKYPARFTTDKREVELTGEAYFEIEKSKAPFFVKNVGPVVKVYGTEFNLDAYDENNVTLALVEGKVSVRHNEKEFFVKPGQLAEYNSYSDKLRIGDTRLDEYTSWKEGYYVFREKSLNSILQKLKYRYNCEFVLDDEELGRYRYSGRLKDIGLNQLMHLLSLTGPIDYKIEKNHSTQDYAGIQVRIKRKN